MGLRQRCGRGGSGERTEQPLQRQPPARGESHTPTHLPSPALPGQQQQEQQQGWEHSSVSHPARGYESSLTRQAGAWLCSVADSHRSLAELPRSPPDQHVALHPSSPAAPLTWPQISTVPGDGRQLGTGGGCQALAGSIWGWVGGCLRTLSLLSPSVCWKRAAACFNQLL